MTVQTTGLRCAPLVWILIAIWIPKSATFITDPARYPPPVVQGGGDSLKMRTESGSAATLRGGVSQTFPMVKLIDLDPILLIPHQPTLVTEFLDLIQRIHNLPGAL